MLRSIPRLALVFAPLLIGTAHAGDAAELDAVVVTGTHIERALPDTPTGATVIDEATLRDGRQGLQLDEALARVPGLFLQNRFNFAQGQRLSLRGFGARAPFGVRGIRIRVDGFPETLPDGQSQIDSIDLDSAVRAEVLRGPSSVLYGNASGGVVSVETANGRSHPGSALRLQAGGDGFFKTSARTGGAVDNFDYHASLSHLDFEGWRAQSQVRKTLLNTKLGVDAGPGQRLEFVLTVLDLPTAQDPGGLSLQQLTADRQQATGAARNLDAGQDVAQQRIGVRYRNSNVAGGEFQTRFFYTNRDFEQQLPFPGPSRVGFNRDFSGLETHYRRRLSTALPVDFVAGAEAQRQKDDRERFLVAPNGVVGNQIQAEGQRATVLAGFAQADIQLLPALTLGLGARLDRLQLAINDKLPDDEDASGSRRFTEPSYSGSLVWRVTGAHRLYANVATAFESPSFTEFARPDGEAGFNPAIQPQETLNREVGLRNGLSGPLHYELSLFSMRVDDEILPFQVDGRNFFENAGRTKRDGVEATLVWRPAPALRLTGSYSYIRLRFDRFEDQQGNDLSGNDIPGIPRQQAFTEVLWQSPRGHFAAIDGQLVGSRFAENSNALEVGSHVTLNLRAGFRHELRQDITLEAFAGITNLLDRDYIANLRVNAGNAGAPVDERGFFEPAPPRRLYAGLALRL